MERKVIVIVGPTCSGKSSLAISLAEELKTEILSADSRQIYKKLNIGTAKPSAEELKKIKHHFIDILNPDEDYNVSRFETEAVATISRLLDAGNIPIVAGGSGLYIKALVDGIFDTVETDPEYRELLLNQKQQFGSIYLYNQLKQIDPESASKMHPTSWKRVMRALEVHHLTGRPIWQHQVHYKRDIDVKFSQLGLKWERKALYENINLRADKMINDGLIEEVEGILKTGYSKELNSLNTVGYKEVIEYLEGGIELPRAVELIKRNTRRYAKRQMTWFRKDDRIVWLDISKYEDIFLLGKKILKEYC